MASACVNNIGASPENFFDCPVPHSSFTWLSPRMSASNSPEKKPNLESPAGDFEFRLDDPAVMLPADELFSDGKLMPLQLKAAPSRAVPGEVRSPETSNSCRRSDGELSFANDPYLFSPKAPRCSSRWRELLGLKKLYQKQENPKTTSSSSSSTSASTTSSSSAKSIRLFLYRNSKTTSLSSSSTSDHSLSLPLLNNTSNSSSDSEPFAISSSRLSLSSSSSSHYDSTLLPRLSLDSPNPARTRPVRATRMGRSPMRRAHPDPTRMVRGFSVDSPRMNSSGRVLFQSLERSSSSPSSLNGGRPNNRYRGMERSYSANVVRVTPVLNVPVCSSLRGSAKSGGVFGFGQLFSSASSSSPSQSQQKRESGNNNGGNGNGNGSRSHGHNHHHHQQSNSRSRNNKKEIP